MPFRKTVCSFTSSLPLLAFSVRFFAVTPRLRRENSSSHVLRRTWSQGRLSFSFPNLKIQSFRIQLQKNSSKFDNVNEMELARVNLILDDNWTKWSAVWFKVLRGMREFDLISDQNCTTPSSTTTFLQPFWNRRIQSVPNHYLLDLAAGLLKSGNKRAVYLILYTWNRWCNIERRWCD